MWNLPASVPLTRVWGIVIPSKITTMNDRRDQELVIRESHSGSCSSRIYLPYLSLKEAAILQGQNRKFKFFLIKPALFFLFVKNLSTYPPPQEDIKGCFNNIFIVPASKISPS